MLFDKLSKKEKIFFTVTVIGTLLTISIYIYFSFKRFYLFDDFELLTQAKRFGLNSIFTPIGVHLRPVMRLHFLLISLLSLYKPIVNNLFSIFLLLISTFTYYLLLTKIYNEKLALLSSLFFLILSSYNEAVFWISANGVFYNFIFINLFFIFYMEKKSKILTLLFLILSFFSYETWLIIIPLILFYRISQKDKLLKIAADPFLIVSIILIFIQYIINKIYSFQITSYGLFKSISEIPYRFLIYFVRSLSPFYTPSFIFFLIIFAIATFFSIYFLAKSKFDFKISFPLILYFAPATIFLLSAKIGSRFYLIPVSGMSVFISFLLIKLINKKKSYSSETIIFTFIFYLIVISPLSLYIDGIDYYKISVVYKNLLQEGKKKLENIRYNEIIKLESKVDDKLFIKFFISQIIKKRKLMYFRKNSIGGFIYPRDYVDYILLRRKLVSKKIECSEKGKLITIGPENKTFLFYCFIVKKLK